MVVRAAQSIYILRRDGSVLPFKPLLALGALKVPVNGGQVVSDTP